MVAGVARFELTNIGIKIRCLTAWRHPNLNFMGRATRIELATSRATIWRSNQLSYARHKILVRLKRFEPLTHGLEGRCSIQLSYRRIFCSSYPYSRLAIVLERVMGIGPTQAAWKAAILPLNYTRIPMSFASRLMLMYYNKPVSYCQPNFTTFFQNF